MKRNITPLISVVAILYLFRTIDIYNSISPEFPFRIRPSLVKEITLSGGYIGLIILGLSITNWIYATIKKDITLVDIHSSLLILYGYGRLIELCDPTGLCNLNTYYIVYHSIISYIFVTSLLLGNLIVYSVISYKNKQEVECA